MTRFLDKLNLRPQERRLVIFVAVVVFAALNWFFVKPYFGELGRLQQRMKDADISIKKFNDEIQRKSFYEEQIKRLSQQGAQVASEEQGTSLTREINNQVVVAGVNVLTLTMNPLTRDGRTNSFFEEQAATLSFNNTGESELVNFLYILASHNSLIRVKSMLLRPDTGRFKLAGSLTLVESFQKKTPVKASAPAPKPSVAPPKQSNSPPKVATPLPKATAPIKASNPPPRAVTTPSAGLGGKTNNVKRVIPMQ